MICTLLSLYALVFSYFGVAHGAETFESNPESCSKYATTSCSSPPGSTMSSNTEQTLVIIKPDGVQRGLLGTIIARFEQKGFKLVAMKLMQVGCTLIINTFCTLLMAYKGLVYKGFQRRIWKMKGC